jgi:ribosomal subunit interface protein
MKTIIQTPDFNANRELLKFVHEKVSKLGRLSDRILESHVRLKLDKSDTQDNKICEIRMIIPGNDLFAFRQCKTFEEATTKVVSALTRQVGSWKNKEKPTHDLWNILKENFEGHVSA